MAGATRVVEVDCGFYTFHTTVGNLRSYGIVVRCDDGALLKHDVHGDGTIHVHRPPSTNACRDLFRNLYFLNVYEWAWSVTIEEEAILARKRLDKRSSFDLHGLSSTA